MTTLFTRPDAGLRLPLFTEPVLESWNAADHPDQLRLNAYLASVADQLQVKEWDQHSLRAVELIVGLPASSPLDRGGRDLDNYLYPLVKHLDARRIAAAFGRKVHQHGSTIAVADAVPADEPDTPALLRVRTHVSAESIAWKQAIHQACHNAVTAPLPPGPLALQLVFGVSSSRNWAALWKPAIDSLGAVLGMPNPARPFRPDDDRIVELSLHRHTDDALGHDVIIEAWWQPAHLSTYSDG
ncbi:hypothetical protein ACFY2Q_04340 [Micromonospora sp. NPDC000316]|uniref:hypothetical protein n=1 Tax=Micromonospora sp. NPDC000316 TaxID=3364216 RepID=UPI0036988F99